MPGKSIVLDNGSDGIIPGLQQAARAGLSHSLRNGNKVGEPAARVESHHIGSDPAFQVVHGTIYRAAHIRFHRTIVKTFLARQQIGVFVQPLHKGRKVCFSQNFNLAELFLLFLIGKGLVRADLVHLLAQPFIPVLVTEPVFYFTQQAYVFCMEDHIPCYIDVTVKPCQRIVGRFKSLPLLCKGVPAAPGLELIGNAGNISRKRIVLGYDSELRRDCAQKAVRLVDLEVWKIPFSGRDRIIPVLHVGLVLHIQNFFIKVLEHRYCPLHFSAIYRTAMLLQKIRLCFS